MKTSRRQFLTRTGCAALGMAVVSSGIEHFGLIHALAEKAAPTDYKALVCMFLSGGNDGNNAVVPLDTTGYNAYAAVRGSSGLALPQGELLPITPTSLGQPFGLHSNLAELHALWGQSKLAIVTNVGPLVEPLTREEYQSGGQRPYQLFSHSDQVAQWQTARADIPSQTGWGGRTADHTLSYNGGSGFPMITSVTGNAVFSSGVVSRPVAIAPAPTGLDEVLVLSGFNTSSTSIARRASMDYLRTIDLGPTLVMATSDATEQALDISTAFTSDPTLGTVFPDSSIANQLKQIAKVIKLNQTSPQLGLNRQIFFCQLGGFDTHQNQVTSQGDLLIELSQAMNAFYGATVELGVADRVTTFTLSDFGRTLKPSGSGATVGSDHGWGNHQFVLGGAVQGGDFYGVPTSNGTPYPTLQLGGPDDTDSRGRWIPTAAVEQYAATLASWFGLAPGDLAAVFPLIGRFTTPDLGFMG